MNRSTTAAAPAPHPTTPALTTLALLLAGSLAGFGPGLLAAQESSPIVGSWEGVLDAGPQGEIDLVFHLSEGEDGGLTATLDVPTQGAMGIPTGETTFEGDSLHITVPAIAGEYRGALRDDGAVDGTWSQGGATLPLVLVRAEKAGGPARPQHPAPPFPYDAEEVRFANEAAGIELAGTFTVPRGAGPFPAVLLITGSGPQDRDETVAGHRVFAVIADHLTREGIAVLRVDDRGVGGSGGDFASADSRDLATDAEAGVDFLASRTEVDPEAVGLVGHSEGGLIAPMVAARDDRVDFLVLLAPPGVPGEELLVEQVRRIAAASGQAAEEVALGSRVVERAVEAARKAPPEERKERIQDAIMEAYDEAGVERLEAMGLSAEGREAAARTQAEGLSSRWMTFFLEHDPRPDLRRVDVPVLALWGSLDLQVAPDQNLPEVEAALEAGDAEFVTVRKLEGLNHLFQHAGTGTPAEYATIEETFAPEALELITGWILEVTGR